MGLMMVILLVQIFMKPSVIINDRDWDIKYELRDLKKTFNQSQMKELEESINQNDQLLTMIDEYEKTSKILLAQNKEFLMELQSDQLILIDSGLLILLVSLVLYLHLQGE